MLKINNLEMIFNEGTPLRKKALNNISLTLNEGDFVSVIGSNGAGKSTLLNCISGSYESLKGDIILDGVSIKKLKEYKRAKDIGRLFQDPLKGTAPSMSIQENLELAYRRGKHNQSIYQKYFKTKISNSEKNFFKTKLSLLNLDLENRLSSKVGLLSGGQRQALTLLMATIIPPKLLLLDEHTAALDPKTAKHVMEITDNIIKENNIATLMITHNIKHALEYGNRLIMMNDGEVIYDFNKEEKEKLTLEDIMRLFAEKNSKELSDKMIL